MTDVNNPAWTPPASEGEARGATHFSCRLPGRDDHFLMLRQGLFFEEITADNLITVDLAGHVIGGADGGHRGQRSPRGSSADISARP